MFHGSKNDQTERLYVISFLFGCYLGEEVFSRVDASAGELRLGIGVEGIVTSLSHLAVMYDILPEILIQRL